MSRSSPLSPKRSRTSSLNQVSSQNSFEAFPVHLIRSTSPNPQKPIERSELSHKKFKEQLQYYQDLSLNFLSSSSEDKKPSFEQKKDYIEKEAQIYCAFGIARNFIKKLVVLEENALLCYRDMSKEENQNSFQYDMIDIREAQVLDCRKETGKYCCFSVNLPNGKRYFFLAPNINEFKEWMTGIQTNSELAKSRYYNSTDLNTNLGEELNSTKSQSLLITKESGEDQDGITSEEVILLDQQLRKHLVRHPRDSQEIITTHLNMILRFKRHPLGRIVTDFINKWKEEHYFLVYTTHSEESLMKTIQTIHYFRDELVHMILDHYAEMTMFRRSRDTCNDVVASVLFNSLHKYLFIMFKKVYEKEDLMISDRINQFIEVSPEHFGLNGYQMTIFEEMNRSLSEGKEAYFQSIDYFKRLPSLKTPLEKVELLVEVGSLICQEYSSFCFHKLRKSSQIGADELLPIFAYIIAKSNVPFLYSECRFMSHLLTSTNGKSAYFLVTFETALSMISLDESIESELTQSSTQSSNSSDLSEMDERTKRISMDLSILEDYSSNFEIDNQLDLINRTISAPDLTEIDLRENENGKMENSIEMIEMNELNDENQLKPDEKKIETNENNDSFFSWAVKLIRTQK